MTYRQLCEAVASARSLTDITATMRAALKAAGIKAKCNVAPSGASIRVVTPSYEARFTADEIRQICKLAIANGLTFVRGVPIDPDHQAKLTGANQWDFYAGYVR